MSWKTLKIFLLLVHPSCLAVTDICQLKGTDLVLHRNYKSGETMCCLRVKCSPGEEAVICDRDDPWSTSCRSCPDDTYQSEETDSVDMVHCAAKTICYGNLSARHERSKTRDTHCICDPRNGFCNPDGVTRNPRSCIKKTCPQGFRLTPKCKCEVCIIPANKSRNEPKPCDKRKRLCRNKRETSTRELAGSTVCPEDDLETPTKAGTALEKKSENGNPGLTSPSGGVPSFSSLIGGQDGVTNDRLNENISMDQVNPSEITWYNIFIPVISVVGVVTVIVCFALAWRGFFWKRESASASSIKKSASAVSNSTDDTYMDDAATEPAKAESASLMSPVLSDTSEQALQCKADAAKDNDVMKLTDKEKLTTQRPLLAQNLVFGECLWAVLLSNETVTPEWRTQMECSSTTDSEKAGALVTYLSKRNSRAFATFLVALIYTKQEHLAKALDPTLTREINEKCPEDSHLISYVLNLV